LTGIPNNNEVILDLGTPLYTAASLDGDGSGYVYDPAYVAICFREEAVMAASEHERFSKDQVVVKATLRATFAVVDEAAVVKITGLPHPA
jgi:HK97 family phage major capsid protein